MEKIKIDPKKPDKDSLEAIELALKENRVVALPTDTSYGLMTNALRRENVKRVFRIKKRYVHAPLSIIIRDLRMAEMVADLDRQDQHIINKFLPGPLTLVVKARKGVLPAVLLAGGDTVGIRLPDYKLIRKLMKRVDFPLTATSANISGDKDLYSADGVIEMYKDRKEKPDLVVDVGKLPNVAPSTVVDATEDFIKILREGPVSKEEFEEM